MDFQFHTFNRSKKKITFFKLSLEFLCKSDGEFQKLEITINLIF